jgi:phosphatidylglycerophosphatase A
MNPATFLASAGGTGYAPIAPGTFGSLVGLLIGALLMNFGHATLFAGFIIVSIAGYYAVRAAGGENDPGWVVIDEVAGQMAAMLALPRPAWLGLLLAFALFRLFDITKPGPIAALDRHPGALGVMADDWLAGLFAFFVLLILLALFPGLFR